MKYFKDSVLATPVFRSQGDEEETTKMYVQVVQVIKQKKIKNNKKMTNAF